MKTIIKMLLRKAFFNSLLLTLIAISFSSINNILSAQKSSVQTTDKIPPEINSKICRNDFEIKQLGIYNENDIEEYLISNLPNLNYDKTGLIFITKTESLKGYHYISEQTLNGIKIFNSQIKVNTDKSGNIISIFDNSYSIRNVPNDDFPSSDVYENYLPVSIEDYTLEKIYFLLNNELIPAIQITITASVENFRELIINNVGEILLNRDLNMYNLKFEGKDTTVTTSIFLPDPLTSSGNFYGGDYTDRDDADFPEITSQIKEVQINTTFDGYFILENRYIKITEHSLPITPTVSSDSPRIHFTRSQPEFENVNVFYHINEFQTYMQRLGFKNLVNYPIHADPHALSGTDQSSFSSGFNPPRLSFGDGGVDDAEDADVILHEYGHAILHSAAPNTNYGYQRQAIDEGFGDYLAASYSKSINPFNWEKVFSWDGHNEFWEGRIANSNKHYPEDLTGAIHESGEIWSSTMMQINQAIGRANTDRILLQSSFSYASNISMRDAAILFIQADSMINNKSSSQIIRNIFTQRGLFTPNAIAEENEEQSIDIKLLNSGNFSNGKGPLSVLFNKPFKGLLNIFDTTGKLIYSKELNLVEQEPIYADVLAKGVYILNIISGELAYNFKLIKI